MRTSKKKSILVILLSVAITIVSYAIVHKNASNDRLPVTLHPFELKKGNWGYAIMVDGKIFIKQECIPAIPGNKTFRSKNEAVKAGNAVMQKLIKGQRPTLSSNEVIALGVVSDATE